MARRDSLDLEILGGVSSEFENFGCEVFEDGGDVDGGYSDTISRLALIVSTTALRLR